MRRLRDIQVTCETVYITPSGPLYKWGTPEIGFNFDNKADAEWALLDWKVQQIPWLTLEQVRLAADESEEAALDSSIAHWQQILEAGQEVYREARKQGLAGHGRFLCALCRRSEELTKAFFGGTCIACPLVKFGSGQCAYGPWVSFVEDWWSCSAEEFDRLAQAMVDELLSVREKLPKKPQMEHGACYTDAEGNTWILVKNFLIAGTALEWSLIGRHTSWTFNREDTIWKDLRSNLTWRGNIFEYNVVFPDKKS